MIVIVVVVVALMTKGCTSDGDAMTGGMVVVSGCEWWLGWWLW